MARYNAVNTRAEEVASKPFQKYGTEASDFVAQINQQQQQGINNVNAAAGSYQPYFDTAESTFGEGAGRARSYIDAATGATYSGMGAVNPGELDINKYMSPYIQNVADTTGAMLAQENERAMSGGLGTAISSGAFGGDRAGIAAANLSQQQNLAYGKTMADIYQQGYGQAVGTAQQQQGVNLGAEQANLARQTAGGAQLAGLSDAVQRAAMEGGQFYAGMGTAAQQAGLAGAEAQINAGTLEQQTEQAGKTALVNQFMQEQGYPFQVAQFLANIATGTGALSGSTTATTQPAPFFSDRRLKHDVKRIGKTDDGLPIYSFKYKGDEKEQTHVGFMADEVEKVKPEAVGVHPTGYKTVDYEKATEKNSMGGGVAPQRAGEAFADGGLAGPYGASAGSPPGGGGYVPQASLPVGDLMVADPAHFVNAQKSMAQQLAALASLGESAKELKGTWDWAKDNWGADAKEEAVGSGESARDVHRAYGGGVDAQYLKPQMGGLAPNSDKSYLTDTLASQNKSDKPKLEPAGGPSGGGSSPAGDIAALAKVGLAIAGIPLPFRYGGAANYADGGAPVRDKELDLGAAIRALGRDAVGYNPGMVDPGLAAGVGMVRRPTGEFPPSRYPDFPTQDDLDRRYMESSARPETFPNEPTSPNKYTPLPMDYGRPLYETQLAATNTLVPRPYMFDGPRGGVAAGETSVGVDQGMQTGAVPAGGVAPPRPTVGPAQDLSFRLPGAPTGALAQPMGGLTMPTGQATETVSAQPPTGGLAPARPAAPAEKPIAYTGVAGAGAGYTDVILPDGTVQRREGTRNWRNNNPGNIEFGPFAEANGAIGSDGRFAVFPTYEAGRSAKEALLFSSEGYAGKTIASAISRYAPASDSNDTAGYIAKVASEIGVDPNTPLSELSPSQRNTMLTAMERIEGGGAGGDGQFASYSTGPVNNGLGVSTKGQGEPQQGGLGRAMLTPDKPYEDRSMAGKMFYNEDGSLNRNAILSGLTGVGAMLSSPSQFFLPSLGLGLQGFAGSYAGLEKQAADIGLTKAQEARERVSADVESFFTSNRGADGYPMVRVGPGRIVSLTDYLKNPTVFSTGDPARDRRIMEEAQRISSSGAPLDTAAATAAPSSVRWTNTSSDAITRAEDYGRANPMNFATNNRIAQEMVVGANDAASSAAEAKPNSNELAYTVGNAISANNMGSVQGWTADNVIAPINAILNTLGVAPISEADTESTILSKLGTLNSKTLTPEDQRAAAVFQQFVEVSPNLKMTPEAAAAITSSLMLANQQDIDKANYYGYFQSQADAGFAPGEMSKGYASEYGQMHQTEKQNLTDLFLAASDPARGEVVKNFLAGVNSGTATQEEAQAVLAYILGAENVSPGLARYFIRGM